MPRPVADPPPMRDEQVGAAAAAAARAASACSTGTCGRTSSMRPTSAGRALAPAGRAQSRSDRSAMSRTRLAPSAVELVGDLVERAVAEDDPAWQRVVDERVHRQVSAGRTAGSASTLTQTDFGSVYSWIASKPISRP